MTPRSPTMRYLLGMLLGIMTHTTLHANERLPVTSLKPLLLRALEQGTAQGVIIGEPATFARQRFDTSAAIEVDVRTIKPLDRPGCSRLDITTRQANVLDKGTREDKRLTFQINYCRDGRMPGASP
jgi:hypothetical protein